MLPHLNATVNESVEQIDFAALGFRFNIPGVPNVVGPIGVFQTGAYLTQSVFDYHAIQRKRGASYNEKAALNSLKNARELVVLAVGNSYLVTLSGAARVDTAQADVTTAQALYDKAADQQKAGVIPAIDALRAHVELQSRQQELIVARNDYAKQKLTLGRVIGLPPGQEFSLTTAAPYEPLATLPLEQDLQRAYASRPDYLAAAQQMRSAEEFRRAATAEYYPSLDIAGDYGAAGIRPGSSHGVFEVGATLNIPIFAGGRTHADVIEAEATLRQSRQQLENLRGQIDYEVRSARLDLNAAADQVEVARSSVDLATQTLAQAQDRFTAGVTDNLEVVQAQDALTSANQTYISALYSHNLAKIELAKAVGFAEEGVRQYLQNQTSKIRYGNHGRKYRDGGEGRSASSPAACKSACSVTRVGQRSPLEELSSRQSPISRVSHCRNRGAAGGRILSVALLRQLRRYGRRPDRWSLELDQRPRLGPCFEALG